MCGRFVYWDSDTIVDFYKCEPAPLYIPAHYNVCPSTQIPVIKAHYHDTSTCVYQLHTMYWGLIPMWTAPHAHNGFINARSETIATKKSFKESFMLRRCIIPIRGYYEWNRQSTTPATKQPFYITTAHTQDTEHAEHMVLAGIWNSYNNIFPSVAIITKPAQLLSHIHERIPVVLNTQTDIDNWLYPTTTEKSLHTILEQSNDAHLHAHQVSLRVNSPKNNDALLMESLS